MALTPNPSAQFEPTNPGDVAHQADHDQLHPLLQPALDAAVGDMFRRGSGGALVAMAAAAAREHIGAQPLDSDLTAIAALSTTAFGRSLLTQASASAARATLNIAFERLPDLSRSFAAPLDDYPNGRSVVSGNAAGSWPGTVNVETVKSGVVGFQWITVNQGARPATRVWTGSAWSTLRYVTHTSANSHPSNDGGVMTWDNTDRLLVPRTLSRLSPLPQILAQQTRVSVFDGVTQADGALNTTDSGHPVVTHGTWQREDGRFGFTATVAGNRYAKVDVGEVDGELVVPMHLAVTAGVLLRGNELSGADGVHWLVVRFDKAAGTVVLRSHPSQTTAEQTLLVAEPVAGLDVSNEVAVRAVGKRVQVRVDGRLVLDHMIPDDINALHQGTHWGFVQHLDNESRFGPWWFRRRTAPVIPAQAQGAGGQRPALTRVVVDEWTEADASTVTRPRGVDPQGRLYGMLGDDLMVSESGDPAGFSVLAAGIGNVAAVELLDDGELLLVSGQELRKTTGFDGESITGTTSVLSTVTTPGFLPRTVKAWRNHVLVTEYSNPLRGHAADHRVWLSTDHGETFDVIFDAVEEFANDNWHLHCVEIDPWRQLYLLNISHFNGQDVWWAPWGGPTDWQPASTGGIYQAAGIGPTTLTAVRRGILVGSDVGSPSGVLMLDPDNGWQLTEESIFDGGTWWANDVRMRRHTDGLLLAAWRVLGATERPGRVTASADGRTWDTIWEDSIVYPSASGATSCFGPTASGHVIGQVARPDPDPNAVFWGKVRVEPSDPVGAR